MKVLILIVVALLIAGCSVEEEECKSKGYEYTVVSGFERTLGCAELDKKNGLIYVNRLDGRSTEVYSIEEFHGLRKIGKEIK